MSLEAVYETQESIPESFRDLFDEKDGRFVINIPGVITEDDAKGVKSALDKERASRRQAERKLQEMETTLSKWEGLDPEEVRETLEKLNADDLDRLKKDGNLDELVAKKTEAMTKDHKRALEALNRSLETEKTARDALQSDLDVLVLERTFRQAAKELGCHQDAHDDIVLAGRQVFTVKDREPLSLDDDGEPVMGPSGTSPMTPADWLKDKKETKTRWWPTSDLPDVKGSKPGQKGVDTSKLSGLQKIELGLS